MYEINDLLKEVDPRGNDFVAVDEKICEDPTVLFLPRGEFVGLINAVHCSVCGLITQWYELWNIGDVMAMEVYCPNCRLNNWIDGCYGFTIGLKCENPFEEDWEEYFEDDETIQDE